MRSLNETLAALVDEAGAERVARLRVAPMSLAQAARLFGALTGPPAARRAASAPPSKASPGKSKGKKGSNKGQNKRSRQARLDAEPVPPAPDESTQAEVLIDAGDAIEAVADATPSPPPLPPLPGRGSPTPAPSKAAFDAVLDHALSGDEVLGAMESVEREIEVDFVEGLADGEDKTELVSFVVGADERLGRDREQMDVERDPLDLERDEEYDIDIDVDAFDQIGDSPNERRAGFYPEDDEPTQAVAVDDFDLDPPPDAELNVRSSIKKLFRKK